MPPSDPSEISLHIQDQLKHFNQYNDYIFNLIKSYCGRRILDAGCSIGNITRRLTEAELVLAADRDERCLDILRHEWNNANLKILKTNFDLIKAEQLRRFNLDTILALNLIEHLENDRRFLSVCRNSLTQGGRLIVFAPAFPSAYGSMDRFDGHHRRYLLRSFSRMVATSGYNIERAEYVNAIGLLFWYIAGKILGRPTLSTPTVAIFDPFFAFIRNLEKVAKPPIGQSIFLVAIKI